MHADSGEMNMVLAAEWAIGHDQSSTDQARLDFYWLRIHPRADGLAPLVPNLREPWLLLTADAISLAQRIDV
jgi:hypothetical protein